MTKPLISIAAALALLISWLIPHHYSPWLTSGSEFSAFAAAIILSLLLFKQKIVLPRISIFIAICALIPIVQWSFGVIFFLGDALIVSFYILGLGCVIMIGHNLSLNESIKDKILPSIASVFIIGAVLSTWIAFRQWLHLNPGFSYFEAYIPPDTPYRPFANFGQPNNLATLLCMGIAGTWYLFEQRRIGVIASSLLAGFLICGVVLTQSRTPWIGAIFILIWWFWKGRYTSPRLSWIGTAAWIGLFVGLVLLLPHITMQQGLTEVKLAEHAQASERLYLWQQFSLAVVQGPWWGYGWNQISVAQIAMSNSFPVAIMTNSSHNILLDLLIWNGPMIGTIFIIVIGFWICHLGYFARSRESVFALLAVGFVLIHGMLEYPLAYAYFLLPVGFLLGMVNGEQNLTVQLPRLPAITIPHFILPKAVFAGFLVMGVSCMIWIGQEYAGLNRDFRTRILTPQDNDTVLLTQLRDQLRLRHSDPTAKMTAEQLNWARNVAYRYPQIANLKHYAIALASNNQPAQAKLELVNLRALYGDTVYSSALNALVAIENQSHALNIRIKPTKSQCRRHHKHSHCK